MTRPEPSKVEQLAELLAVARRGGPKVPLAAGTGLAREQAFDVQSRLIAEFGPVGGFKVACPPDAPIVIAPIFAKNIVQSPGLFAVPPGERVGIELEYAYRLTSPLPSATAPDFKDHLRSSVELLPVIELVQSRLEDPASADPTLKMADNQLNGALVLGTPLPAGAPFDTSRASGHLKAGDEVLLDGVAKVPGGDAFETLYKLALAIGQHCGGLQVGQVVITGSLNGLPWVLPEKQVHGHIDGLGDVSLLLTAE